MQLDYLNARAFRVANLYDRLNEAKGRRVWTTTDYMSGFVGDVGDLSKLVMAHEGVRDPIKGHPGVAHEVADCLFSTLVLADRLGVSLARVFPATMTELEDKIMADIQAHNA